MGNPLTATTLRHLRKGAALKVAQVTHTRPILRHCATCVTSIVVEGGGGAPRSRTHSTLSRAAHTRPAPSACRGALAARFMRTT
jgi:hypothetical protein